MFGWISICIFFLLVIVILIYSFGQRRHHEKILTKRFKKILLIMSISALVFVGTFLFIGILGHNFFYFIYASFPDVAPATNDPGSLGLGGCI